MLVLQHGGGVSGFGARNALVPASRSAVGVMANADWAGGVLDAIEGAVLAKLMPVADAPTVTGPPAREVALTLLAQIRAGDVDRGAARRGVQRVPDAGAARGDVEVAGRTPARSATCSAGSIRERGGMEVSTLAFDGRHDRRHAR